LSRSAKKIHWTHKLFVENAELYLPFLEQAKERAPDETNALAEIFDENEVPGDGFVLDLACGIGRHSIPLARLGYRVVGVDISPLYVEKAREYAAREGVEALFVEGDMLDVLGLLEKQAPFDAIINMFTSHSYYGREGDVRTFSQLRRMASKNGLLVVLTVNGDWIRKNFQEEGLETAMPMRILQQRRLDESASTIYNTWHFFEGQEADLKHRLTLDMEHRLYSIDQLAELLEGAGWRFSYGLGRQPGDEFLLGPLGENCNAMWLVART
jgi:SAM-dependent methyltransferase